MLQSIKALSIIFFFPFIAVATVFGQTNEYIQFKGIAWNQGGLLSNEILVVKSGIKAGDTFLYQETQTVSSDENGFYSVHIGEGEEIQGDYGDIEWSAVNTEIQIEIDKLFNGTGFQLVAQSKLVSVPYANYAAQIISKKGPTGPTGLHTCPSEPGSQTGPAGPTGYAPWTAEVDSSISTSLHVGIGTSEPTVDLEVAGNICYSGVAGSCSDRRFKTEIENLNGSLENLLQINGYTYSWKLEEFPEKNFQDKKQVGIIAQELEEYYPELVSKDRRGFKSVDYTKLSSLVLAAKQEQDREIESLIQLEKELSERISTIEEASDTKD